MWDPHHLTTLWASTACYGDGFTFKFQYIYDSDKCESVSPLTRFVPCLNLVAEISKKHFHLALTLWNYVFMVTLHLSLLWFVNADKVYGRRFS
jgi:hypothetical protein